MAETINQEIADRQIERQLRAGRVESGLRRELWAELALLEAELLAALKVADPTAYALLTRRRNAVQALLDEEFVPLILARYRGMAVTMTEAMQALAVQEVAGLLRLINTTAPEPVLDTMPADVMVERQVRQALIPTATKPTDLSATGEEWWARQAEGLTRHLHDQMLVSVSLGEPLASMIERIRGTPAQGLTDGIMERARSDAARLARTQTTSAVTTGRDMVATRNAGETVLMHSSVLDSRTSSICLSRHGLRFEPVTHAPIGHSIPYLTGPPYHPSCRSTMIVVLRTGGRVAVESVNTWLQRRDTAFQDALLGPTRAQMFRAGRLGVRDLLESATGRPLTLEELRA